MEEADDPEDAEAAQEQEEYIANLVADCPTFPPDLRQEFFFSSMDEMRKNPDWKDLEVIPMGGFRASAVDLGWLKDRAIRIVVDKLDDHGPHGVAHLVCMMLRRCVQRLKGEMVGADTDRNTIEVLFETKDDEGHYEYRFAIPLPVQDGNEAPESGER